ncbi:hypothetical protein [Aliikangiella maris]|uniref:Uncharacterized protein n=2 Tax=Aliikangiella maris TaxID=3162458 RepID=A0ABV2BT67_9GAMM
MTDRRMSSQNNQSEQAEVSNLSNKHVAENLFIDDATLADFYAQLPVEQAPERDLWPAIENRLQAPVTKIYNRRWIPLAIAASLLLSIMSLGISWQHLQKAEQTLAQAQLIKLQYANVEQATTADVNTQIKAMELEYHAAKSALLMQIGLNQSPTEHNLLAEVSGNLMIIEHATQELKAALAKKPADPLLINLLNSTYQQELAVLSKLVKIAQSS